jgi:hypothetical protein
MSRLWLSDSTKIGRQIANHPKSKFGSAALLHFVYQ